MQEDALEFFNGLSGDLHIELSEPATEFSPNLANQVAPASAHVTRVELGFRVYVGRGFRELTDEEWDRVVIHARTIRMANRRVPDVVVEHAAPDGRVFTVRALRDAVAKTERESRDRSDWFEGVDVHHVYFEGISLENGVWYVEWGS
jgi:hypothetical protein